MNNKNGDTTKLLLILIIISLIILGIMGSIYYFSQSKARILYVRSAEKYKLGTIEDIRNGIQSFRYLVTRYPNSRYAPKAMLQIGKGYELIFEKSKDERKLDIAEEEYYKIKKHFGNTLEAQNALFQIAHINYLKNDYEEAQEKLDYILAEYVDTPLKPQIYTKKGYIYYQLGEYKKALRFFNRKEASHDDLALTGKGECFFKLGEYDKALLIFEDFIQYRKLSNYRPQVIKSFLDNCYFYAKKLATEKDYKQSNKLFDKIISLFPDHKLAENALYWKAENYYDQKQYKNAIYAYQDVTKNSFTHKDDAALFKLGMCYFEQDMFEESLKYFQNIIDYYPDSMYLGMSKDWKKQSIREIKYRQ
ncbi:MAG: tetratricopeptide repeat protein [Spirochaetes bacterium]|nr:tetratricopeptide repeat protein [Spirochaetota bacterium]